MSGELPAESNIKLEYTALNQAAIHRLPTAAIQTKNYENLNCISY